jgi:hypothetical protein
MEVFVGLVKCFAEYGGWAVATAFALGCIKLYRDKESAIKRELEKAYEQSEKYQKQLEELNTSHQQAIGTYEAQSNAIEQLMLMLKENNDDT